MTAKKSPLVRASKKVQAARDPGDHKCFDEADKKLAPKNTRLSYMFGISPTSVGTFLRIATEKLDPAKRGKPVAIVANYCPFCGKKLTEAAL